MTYTSSLLSAARKLTGLTAESVKIAIEDVDVIREVIRERSSCLVADPIEVVRQILPQALGGASAALVKILNLQRAITTPLVDHGRVVGILSIQSETLTEADVPTFTAFGMQLGSALEKARLIAQLETSEERFRLAASIASDLCYEWDVQTDSLHWWLGNLGEALGYEPGEIEETIEGWTALIHPDDRARLQDMVEIHRSSTEPIFVEYRVRAKDGSWHTWEDRGNPKLGADGKPVRWIGVCSDLSKQREAEQELQDLVHASQEAVFFNSKGSCLLANPEAARMFGYPDADSLKGIFGTDVIAPESHAVVRERMLNNIPGSYEVVAQRADGSTFPAQISARSMTLRGEPVRCTVVRDIGPLKEAERERHDLQQQLHQARKMEAMGRLAGGVAHDFNNILCAIMGNASIALAELPRSNPLRELVQEIDKAARQAAEMTKQLLAFSRKQVIAPKVLNLGRLIQRMCPMLVRLIGEDIILNTDLSKELGAIEIDPGQIEQVVLNLALNARDAMPDGGELSIAATDVTLGSDFCDRHGTVEPGRYVMLMVRDQGLGINSETLEKIFDPFFTTKKFGEGTGLGLATVLGIVEQNGGIIDVHTTPQEGSTFRVYLPRASEETESPAGESATWSAQGEEMVLVVEDEDLVRTAAKRILERSGYRVLLAASGDEALALAAQHEGPIDLLLTDVIMPRMNGRQLADEMVKVRPGIIVLFTSGYTEDVIGNHGVLGEGINFIGKPYSPEGLVSSVREALDQPQTSEQPLLPEVGQDGDDGVGAVHGVEVQPRHAPLQQLCALPRGQLDAEAGDRALLTLRQGRQPVAHLRGDGGAADLGQALHELDAVDRHHPRDHGHCDAAGPGLLDEVEVEAVVVEVLCHDVLGAAVLLELDELEIAGPALGLDVPLGVGRRADAERVALLDQRDEVRRVGQGVRVRAPALVPGRRVAADGEDGLHPQGGAGVEVGRDVIGAHADAGQIGHHGEAEFVLKRLHQLDGAVALGPPRAEGNGDVVRLHGLELGQRLAQLRRRPGGLGPRNLE